MLSNARIYLFGVIYKGQSWLSISDCDQLSGMIANIIKNNIPQLKFKNLQIFNICNKKTSNEIHINKILYNERKILNKTDIAELRLALQTQLKKIQQLTFEQIHVINDEFSERISPNYLTELL